MFTVESAYAELYSELKYNRIYDYLCERVDSGSISLEDAMLVNEEAFSRLINGTWVQEPHAIVRKAEESSPVCVASLDGFFAASRKLEGLIMKLNAIKDQDIKIKPDLNIDEVMRRIAKNLPPLLGKAREFTKASKTGKVTFAMSQLIGWTVLFAVPQSSNITYGVTSIIDFILEWKRRWNNETRSALLNYASVLDNARKANQNKYSTDSYNINAAEISAISTFKKAFDQGKATINALAKSILATIQTAGAEAANATYVGGKKIGQGLQKISKDGSRTNEIGKKMEKIGTELNNDVKTLRAQRKKNKAIKNRLNYELQQKHKDIDAMNKGNYADIVRRRGEAQPH